MHNIPSALSFNVPTKWSGYGVNSEYAPLRKVMLHFPGFEINNVSEPEKVCWREKIDLSKAQEEINQVIEFYTDQGVEVILLKPDKDLCFPNHLYMRDLFTMTPFGAVLMRPAVSVRQGEEVATQYRLAQSRIPIALSIHGDGVFEGPDMMYLDSEKIILGIGIRTNAEGIRQIKVFMESHGFETFVIETELKCHLDAAFTFVNKNTAIVYPDFVGPTGCEFLRKMGFKLIEIPDQINDAANLVQLSPEEVVMRSGTPEQEKAIRDIFYKEGIKVHFLQVNEILKGGGALHCITGVVERELI